MAPTAVAELAIDETYVKVRGQWAYLYRALDKLGNTIDFYLSSTRNTKAAKRFLGKALNGLKDWEQPEVLNTDKAPTYAGAIAELKAEGKCPNETRHRQVKYLNNVVEADHGKLKLLLRPVRGFKTLKTAYATIKGFEVMRALRKGQAGIFALQAGIVGEARIVERAFGLDRGHGVATKPSGQRRSLRRTRYPARPPRPFIGFATEPGELRDRTEEGQHYRIAGINLLAAIIIYWNTLKLGEAVLARNKALEIPVEFLTHVSPLGWEHINLTGEYRWPGTDHPRSRRKHA